MIKIAIAVVSDSSWKNERQSTTQDIIADMLVPVGTIACTKIIPDEKLIIQQTLVDWADQQQIALIVTTGGTGLSPKDQTPEATWEILEKEIPGIPEYIRIKTSRLTPLACLSRSVCGIRNQTLIINLPGSEKAVREWVECLIPLLPHALEVIQGRVHRCGG